MLQWIAQKTKHTQKIVAISGLLFAALFCFLSLVEPSLVHAQTGGSIANPSSTLNQGVTIIEQPLGLPAYDIRVIIARIIRVALGLIGIVMVVLMLYAGFLWMTAGGNEEQIGDAKKIIKNATIGLAIILSAYSIVLFVMRLLGLGVGGQGDGYGAQGLYTQNFKGSGALGGIIKDHYPARNQKNVARNTRIVITFRKPILLDSFVTDTSRDGVLGTCNVTTTMIWERDCDRLTNLDANHIAITRADTGEAIRGANVLASYENGKVYTIVIRPYDYLGSTTTDVGYVVHLGKEIRLDDAANNNPSAFNVGAVGNDFYEWKFTCGTELDLSPPKVIDVFPGVGGAEPRNSVIQINFSEAVDPIGIQGSFVTTSGGYSIPGPGGSSLFITSANSSRPSGAFRLTNGYKTLEFTPDLECTSGSSTQPIVNACGAKMYCLPVCDKPGANCNADNFKLLVKAAETFTTSSFEAVPFSGTEDLAGNALDSDPYGTVNRARNSQIGSVFDVQNGWLQPDNYFWSFTIKNEIDFISPELKQIKPGLDSAPVTPEAAWQMVWSKRMRIDPLYDIAIDQLPSSSIPLCKVPRISFNQDQTTVQDMDHCPFLDGVRAYYFPIITSAVEDAHFNCFFPSRGPGEGNPAVTDKQRTDAWTAQGALHAPASLVCDAAHPLNCCQVTSTPETRALCCNGVAGLGNASTTASCLNALKQDSP